MSAWRPAERTVYRVSPALHGRKLGGRQDVLDPRAGSQPGDHPAQLGQRNRPVNPIFTARPARNTHLQYVRIPPDGAFMGNAQDACLGPSTQRCEGAKAAIWTSMARAKSVVYQLVVYQLCYRPRPHSCRSGRS